MTLFAVRALVSVAAAAGVVCQPHNNDDNFVHCTDPNDILNDFLANQNVSLRKSPNLKTTPKRRLLGEANLPR